MNPINATQAYAGHSAEAAYSRWAPIYDLIFDLPFHPGRAAAARAAAQAAGPGGEILVVGVGTGLELPLLPGNVLVTGIDISAPMLRAARTRVDRKGLAQVKGLHVMDAGALEFPDAAFDVALAPYVMSVVPSPDRVLAEAWRVLGDPARRAAYDRAQGPGQGTVGMPAAVSVPVRQARPGGVGGLSPVPGPSLRAGPVRVDGPSAMQASGLGEDEIRLALLAALALRRLARDRGRPW